MFWLTDTLYFREQPPEWLIILILFFGYWFVRERRFRCNVASKTKTSFASFSHWFQITLAPFPKMPEKDKGIWHKKPCCYKIESYLRSYLQEKWCVLGIWWKLRSMFQWHLLPGQIDTISWVRSFISWNLLFASIHKVGSLHQTSRLLAEIRLYILNGSLLVLFYISNHLAFIPHNFQYFVGQLKYSERFFMQVMLNGCKWFKFILRIPR